VFQTGIYLVITLMAFFVFLLYK